MFVNLESFVIQSMQKQSQYLGDDAAVVEKCLYSQDAFFENIHFKREWLSAYEIGAKAMLVNLSDAIAMNAKPKFALVTLAFPKSTLKKDLSELMRGLHETAASFGCEIIGGDTIANTKIDLSITIISEGSAILERKGAKEGDLLAYTGTLGSVGKDLRYLLSGGKPRKNSKFTRPILRVKFIEKARPLLHGGMDISDGLLEDSKKLTKTINRSFFYDKNLSRMQKCSGEEYEMLVSFPARNLKALMRIAKATRTPLTVFGIIAKNKPVRVCKANHF